MCDTLIAGRDVTACGHTIFGKNSDRSCNEPQYFVTVPHARHDEAQVRCTFLSIPQVRETYGMILSKPSWIWGAEMGVNECGVVIGNEAVYSKETAKEPALLGMDLLRLALERAATAREAVNVISALLETHGQGGNASFDGAFYYDNAFMIADPFETWYLETAGKYWGARQVKGALAISNHMMLGQPDLMHPQAVAHAREAGYPVAEPFDFTGSYCDWDRPNNVSGFIRQSSGQHMLDLPGAAFDLSDMFSALRSHTTEQIWTRGDTSVCKHATGSASESSTTNTMIAVLEPGNISLWGSGMSTPCIAPFQPFWMDAYSPRLVWAYDRQEEAMDAWLRLERLNRAMLCGRLEEAAYRQELNVMQGAWLKESRHLPRAARQAFCDEVARQADAFTSKWLSQAEGTPARYASEEARDFWKRKNAALGQNRAIAY